MENMETKKQGYSKLMFIVSHTLFLRVILILKLTKEKERLENYSPGGT